jgi:hypothetical protein
VFSVSRDFVRSCSTPAIVLEGSDLYHPKPISEEIIQLNPRFELIEEWKTEQAAPDAAERVRAFLKLHQG